MSKDSVSNCSSADATVDEFSDVSAVLIIPTVVGYLCPMISPVV